MLCSFNHALFIPPNHRSRAHYTQYIHKHTHTQTRTHHMYSHTHTIYAEGPGRPEEEEGGNDLAQARRACLRQTDILRHCIKQREVYVKQGTLHSVSMCVCVCVCVCVCIYIYIYIYIYMFMPCVCVCVFVYACMYGKCM
jgi:hypothetical protein